MEKLLTGKIAVVTGGTRGIGRAIAEALLREGASVAICGRDADQARQAADEMGDAAQGRAIGEACDVSRFEEVRKFFRRVKEQFGALDVLVNNAGLGIFAATADLTREQWDSVIALNLNGPFYCSHEAIPLFRERGSGYIFNISSLAGKNPFAGGSVYNASKFGLNGFSEAMMLDHRQENIRVTYIMPGSVDTDFSPRSGKGGWKIQPEDIAEIVIDLLRLPSRTLVSRVEVRPSKPPR